MTTWYFPLQIYFLYLVFVSEDFMFGLKGADEGGSSKEQRQADLGTQSSEGESWVDFHLLTIFLKTNNVQELHPE